VEGFFHCSAVEVVKLEREQVMDAVDAEDLAIGTKQQECNRLAKSVFHFVDGLSTHAARGHLSPTSFTGTLRHDGECYWG
jgi:hypothetical protein